eukprot:1183395-Prorocentrum_minimum.AAC.6
MRTLRALASAAACLNSTPLTCRTITASPALPPSPPASNNPGGARARWKRVWPTQARSSRRWWVNPPPWRVNSPCAAPNSPATATTATRAAAADAAGEVAKLRGKRHNFDAVKSSACTCEPQNTRP